jgi:hypothetical protein
MHDDELLTERLSACTWMDGCLPAQILSILAGLAKTILFLEMLKFSQKN